MLAAMDETSRAIAAEVIRAARGGDGVLVATVIDGPADATPAPGAKLLLRPDGSRLGSFGSGALEEAIDLHGVESTLQERSDHDGDGCLLEETLEGFAELHGCRPWCEWLS